MPDAVSTADLSPLTDLVGRRALPWAEQGGMKRVVIARSSAACLQLPPDVQASEKKLVSRRKSVRGQRMYGNASNRTALFSQDDQEIVRVCSLVCVTAGHADFQIGDYILHCPEGTFIFIPPGLPHPRGERSHLEGENRHAGSCDLLWFSQRGRRVQCWTCRSRGSRHEVSNGLESVFLLNGRMAQYFDTMEEEATTGLAGYEKMFQGALQLFLLTAHRELSAGHYLQLMKAGSEEYQKPRRLKDYDPIERAEEYIRSNLGAVLTIDRVAGAVHMSRAQFTRRFLAQTGCTFTQYINNSRLEQAKMFLRETDWAVGQICEFVGFRSAAYFHTLFRRRLGTSPIAFRLASQNEARTEFGQKVANMARRSRAKRAE